MRICVFRQPTFALLDILTFGRAAALHIANNNTKGAGHLSVPEDIGSQFLEGSERTYPSGDTPSSELCLDMQKPMQSTSTYLVPVPLFPPATLLNLALFKLRNGHVNADQQGVFKICVGAQLGSSLRVLLIARKCRCGELRKDFARWLTT